MGVGAYKQLIKRLVKELEKHPVVTEAFQKVVEEEAGPYGPAIRERQGELWKEAQDIWKKGPQKVGEDYPFFPPGVFSPYPKAFEEQGDQGNLSWEDGGVRRSRDIPAEEIDKLVARVLGARPGEGDGRGRRPFNFG